MTCGTLHDQGTHLTNASLRTTTCSGLYDPLCRVHSSRGRRSSLQSSASCACAPSTRARCSSTMRSGTWSSSGSDARLAPTSGPCACISVCFLAWELTCRSVLLAGLLKKCSYVKIAQPVSPRAGCLVWALGCQVSAMAIKEQHCQRPTKAGIKHQAACVTSVSKAVPKPSTRPLISNCHL